MSPQNVILVTIDSVRADNCGFLSSPDTTPNLDAIAEDSLVFEDAIAPGPQTLSSVPAVHTGEPLPITSHDIVDYSQRINRIRSHIDSHQTISERFRELGYDTGCVEANPWTSQVSGIDEGYDIFRDVGGKQRDHVSDRFAGTPVAPVARTVSRWYHDDGWFSRWPQYYDEILSVVEELSEPYFLWVFLLDTHNPYFVGRRDRVESSTSGMYYSLFRANSVMGGGGNGTSYTDELPTHVDTRIQRAYRDSIRSADRFIGELLSDLDDDDPLFALYSDHGEGFGEHGRYGHQHALYEENIHVPLLLHNAGEQARISDPTSLLKLPAMLEAYATNEAPSPEEWTDDYVYSRTEDSATITVRGSRWKYLRSPSGEQLFDLEADPAEQMDRSEDEPEMLERLRQLKDERLDSLPERDLNESFGDTDEVQDRLDALGYVG